MHPCDTPGRLIDHRVQHRRRQHCPVLRSAQPSPALTGKYLRRASASSSRKIANRDNSRIIPRRANACGGSVVRNRGEIRPAIPSLESFPPPSFTRPFTVTARFWNCDYYSQPANTPKRSSRETRSRVNTLRAIVISKKRPPPNDPTSHPLINFTTAYIALPGRSNDDNANGLRTVNRLSVYRETVIKSSPAETLSAPNFR